MLKSIKQPVFPDRYNDVSWLSLAQIPSFILEHAVFPWLFGMDHWIEDVLVYIPVNKSQVLKLSAVQLIILGKITVLILFKNYKFSEVSK